MSDLQCPATLLIARHGDAEYALGDVLSDDGGRLTDLGRAQVNGLVGTLRSRRITAVYSSRVGAAGESGRLAAAGLDVRRVVTYGLQEFSVGELAASAVGIREHQVLDGWLRGDLEAGFPGAEDGRAVVERFKQALEQIADTHRGETVLVFTHSGVMSLAIPRLSVNVRNDQAAQHFPPNCAPAEVEVDADGWRVLSWPGAKADAGVPSVRAQGQ